MQEEKIRDFFEKHIGVNSQKVLDEICKHAIAWKADKGEIIVHKGKHRREVAFLMSGAVKWYDLDEKGNEKVYWLDYFPEWKRPLILATDLSAEVIESLYCVTAVDSVLVSFPYEMFMRLMTEFGLEMKDLIRTMMSEAFRESCEMVKVYGDYSAVERILWSREKFPELSDYFSNRDIARFLKITPETYSRTINKLKKK